MKVKEIAALLNAEKVVGKDTVEIEEMKKPEEACQGSIVCLHDSKLIEQASAASAVVVSKENEGLSGTTQIICPNTNKAFLQLLDIMFEDEPVLEGISAQANISAKASVADGVSVEAGAFIDDNAEIGSGCVIKANAYIGKNVKLGANCIIYPNANVGFNCILGEGVIVYHGAVIGGDGFGYEDGEDGKKVKIPQRGNVVIGDYAEIGANATIDRATLGSTKLGNHVKVDNLVQIAHNCEIGENTVIAALCGIAGSSSIGSNCILAGQVGISDHCQIGDKVIIAAASGVMSKGKVPSNSIMWGRPVQALKQEKLSQLGWKKLPELISFIEKEHNVKFKIPR